MPTRLRADRWGGPGFVSRQGRPGAAAGIRDALGTSTVRRGQPELATRAVKPWTLDETLDFLAVVRKDLLYAAFVLAIAMGLRGREIVGLLWSALDLDNRVLYARQQTQRRRGVLYDDDPPWIVTTAAMGTMGTVTATTAATGTTVITVTDFRNYQ